MHYLQNGFYILVIDNYKDVIEADAPLSPSKFIANGKLSNNYFQGKFTFPPYFTYLYSSSEMCMLAAMLSLKLFHFRLNIF